MTMFIVLTIAAIIFAILTAIFSIRAFLSHGKGNRNDKIVAVCTAIGALVLAFRIDLPEPIIYPLDNETRRYIDKAEITIETYDFLDTYYSVDGSDPNQGYIYVEPIVIKNSSTISARNKFLFWWSDISKNSYQFEETDNSDNKTQQLVTSEEETSQQNYSDTQEESTNSELQTEPSETLTETETFEGTETETQISSEQNSLESNVETTPAEDTTPIVSEQKPESPNVSEGQNPSEGANLMNYVNQYRIDAGVEPLVWTVELEQAAQGIAESYAIGTEINIEFYLNEWIGRRCNGAKNAQRAVSDWITGNAYISSKAELLLNADFTQMGGALYFLPNGDEGGYHYFWIICLK